MATPGLFLPALLGAAVVAAPVGSAQDQREAVKAMLLELHQAAAEASMDYFQHIEPGAILYGTDATERWTVEQFRELIAPFFAAGEGFATMPTETHVYLAGNGTLAWFEEQLRSAKFGEMRATGVARLTDGRWRLVHYNTMFPVPNGVFRELVGKIAEVRRQPPGVVAEEQAVGADVKAVLEAFHRASLAADLEGTLKHFAEDAIYFGTDPGERFTVAQLDAFIAPYFAQGQGWTASPWSQRVYLSADGTVAWFDERLTSESWGEMRGSGVLVRDAEEWKIVQFHLGLPLPNELVDVLLELRGR